MASVNQLKLMADKLRVLSIRATTAAGSGHPTSCLSCADIMSALFFSEFRDSDEFILSKGHAAPILWAVYAEAGIISEKDLLKLRDVHSVLEGHPTKRMPCTKIATGSLGQGLSAGVGMGIAKKIKKDRSMVYVLLGDGEVAEGSVWEAANSAAYYRLDNVCAIVDVNRLGQSQETMHGHDVNAYKKKFKAFGWNAAVVDGHSISQLVNVLKRAKKSKKPFAIIAKTFKGKGVKFIENKEGYHGKPLSSEDAEKAVRSIGENDIVLPSNMKTCKVPMYSVRGVSVNRYKIGEKIATRAAFGRALLRLGEKNENIAALDGDVLNSTMTEEFFKKFPKRSVQSFIAEQNMIGMAMGMSAMSLIPFASTFATFLTRAHDFIRMAQYSQVNLNIVGSHTGVSIGSDGPSQMGLEDISMFLSMPDSVVLQPCEGVSAEALTVEMAKHKGIVYLRTIREETPVLYKSDERFRIGGMKVLKRSKKDKALIVATGITVFEALKAYDILKAKGVNVRIADLYSIKPLDSSGLLKNAKECKGNIIVVEDHYPGGAGAMVSSVLGKVRHLCVKKTPRSGKPEELRRMFGIDASAIVKEVTQIARQSVKPPKQGLEVKK